jgi:hypothetical protein
MFIAPYFAVRGAATGRHPIPAERLSVGSHWQFKAPKKRYPGRQFVDFRALAGLTWWHYM